MNKQLRKILCAGLAAAVMAATAVTASAASAADFTDVKPTAWYYNAVDYAATESLFAGTGDGKFSPDMGMTRGMFVTVLGRKSGVSNAKPASSRFSDVEIKDYFSPYTEWAAKYEIVSGTGNGKFSPNDRITREQMAKVLYGYAQKTGNDTSVDPAKYDAFPDTGKVSGYAVQAMKWAVSHGIINGSDGKLDPKGTATRAQVAQVFLNSRDVLIKTEITDEPVVEPDVPTIELTPEQRAQLHPMQDPDEVLRRILAGTDAKWNPDIDKSKAYQTEIMKIGIVNVDEWQPEYSIGSTQHASFNALEYINNTGADTFYIEAYDTPHIGEFYTNGKPAFSGSYLEDGSFIPSRWLMLYYTIPDKADSALMKAAREFIESKFPNARFEKMGGVHGWRGAMQADSDLSLAENAQRIANAEIRYLSEWNSENDTFSYWLSEPKPGVFYFFY